jgi:hypothetical protein
MRKYILGGVGACVVALSAFGCVSESSGIGQAAQGCDELQTGNVDNITVDVKVRAFLHAAVDLRAVTDKMKTAVHDACVHIASDLGANDTWSALSGDDSIANKNNTGACDAARAKISAIMDSDAAKTANFALVVSRGECHADFKAEADCETGCAANTMCDPGKVEDRCEPGKLSVTCTDKCAAQSYCVGKVDVEAACSGKCEASCHGQCDGTCTDETGNRTENDANCHGKCSTSCHGKCTGRCQIEESAGIACGANIACEGSCTSTFTNPVCTTTFTPPKCTIDESCFESCRASVTAKTVCEPPTVSLEANVQNGDVQKLVATINANLPAVIDAAEAQGKLALQVGGRLVATGSVVLQNAGNLDGKSIACVTAAAKSAGDSAATLQVSADASGAVSQSCSSRAQ